MKYSRNRKQLEAWKREEGFDNRIVAAEKRQTYNALNDEHSGYYFVLPSVQDHLKRMRRAIRRELSSEADRLGRSIDRKIESFDMPIRKKSKKKHEKQKLMAKNFINQREIAGRTELLRPQRNESSNTERQQVIKNNTEGRLPPLTKRTDKMMDHSETTDRTANIAMSLKHKIERSDHPTLDISSHASIQHEKFQKFLDEKRQQVLKQPDQPKSEL